MPITVKYIPKRYISYWTKSPCLYEEVWSNFSSYVTIKTADNPVESRVHPPKPYWKYPTPQALQYTERSSNPYYQKDTVVSTMVCNGETVAKVTGGNWVGAKLGRQLLPPDTNWALDLRLRIKDRKVNLGAHLVEFRDAANMFYKFAVHSARAYRDFKKTWKRGKLTPCTVGTNVLTMNYGIMPLASDLFDSVQHLQDRLASEQVYDRVTVTSKVKEPFTKNGCFGYWKVEERAIVYLELEPENYYGFTAGNPLELGWEAVPFSFVLDWVIPIGDYLSSLDALKGVKAVTGTLTRKEEYYHSQWTGIAGMNQVRPGIHRYKSHKRDVLYSIPLPRAPSWEPSFHWKKIANGLSLLGTMRDSCSYQKLVRNLF